MIDPSSKNSIKRSLGYSKLKTDIFQEKKREILAKKDRFRSSAAREAERQRNLNKDTNNVNLEIGMTGGLPPVWVDYYEETLEKFKSLERISQDTAKLINSRIKMQFGDHSDLDNQINQKTDQAKQLLHECEENHKRIHDAGFRSAESMNDKRIRENVERILATKIQEWAMIIRKQQKSLLNRIKDLPETGTKDSGHNLVSTEYTEEMRQEMEAMDDIARERDEDVNRLIDTINELSHLFKQMNHLVIEQGTIVDRIDYNLESAVTHVAKGKEQLRKAHTYQRSKCGDNCIKILIILDVIFTILLILKYGHRS